MNTTYFLMPWLRLIVLLVKWETILKRRFRFEDACSNYCTIRSIKRRRMILCIILPVSWWASIPNLPPKKLRTINNVWYKHREGSAKQCWSFFFFLAMLKHQATINVTCTEEKKIFLLCKSIRMLCDRTIIFVDNDDDASSPQHLLFCDTGHIIAPHFVPVVILSAAELRSWTKSL